MVAIFVLPWDKPPSVIDIGRWPTG